MPSLREASSRAIIAWTLGTCGTATASCPCSAPMEGGTLVAEERRHRAAVVVSLAEQEGTRDWPETMAIK